MVRVREKWSEPRTGSPVGAALAEARALAAALGRCAQTVRHVEPETPTGRATIAVTIGGLAGGVGLLAVALAQAGRLPAAQRIAEATDGRPRDVLAALADRIVAGELE